MKKLLMLILIVIAINFFWENYSKLAAKEIESSTTFSYDNADRVEDIQLQEDRQLIKLLKFSLIILALLWGLSFYFYKIKIMRSKGKAKGLFQPDYLRPAIQDHETMSKGQSEKYLNVNKQLNLSQEQYKTLVENLHEGMVIVDKNENFQFVNRYALDIYGCEEQQMIGHNVSEFTDEFEFKRIIEQTSLRKTGIASKYELVIRRPSGEQRIVKVSASPIFEADKFKGSVGVFVDITEQKKNELIQEVIFNISNAVNTSSTLPEMYKKIHKILGVVIDTTNFYIALYDHQTNIIHTPYYIDKINKTTPAPQMMGNGLTAHVIHTGKPLYLTVEKRKEMIDSGIIPPGEWQSKIWLGAPLKFQEEIIGAIAVQSYENADQFSKKDLWLLEFVSDQIALVISRKRTEKALQESEVFNRAIIENSPLAISARDNKGRLLIANKAWMKLWGKTKSDMAEDTRQREHFHLDERDDYLGEFKPKVKEIYKHGGELYIPEIFVVRKRSGQKNIWISQYFYALMKDSSKVDKIIIITENITERKLVQDELKSSLKEKEILLKEVHHRVKNNMQVISSMLKLQSRYLKDEKSLELFQECQSRVKSMALIHEKLYLSKNFEKIDFDQYIKTLTTNLLHSFSKNGCDITAKIKSNNVHLNMTKAIPFGLIINELISNSLKHAFRDRKKGKIKLIVKQEGENYILDYSDDGTGFPEELDFRKTDSLGMQIINALSKQLQGKIKMTSKKGTAFQIIFPID